MRSLALHAPLCLVVALFWGCESDQDPTPTGKLVIHLEELASGARIFPYNDGNNFRYTNAAGNRYGVETLEYLISDFTLLGDDGHAKHDDVHELAHYRNAFVAETDSFELSNVVAGDYQGIHFWWGVAPEKNFGSADPHDHGPKGLPSEFDSMLWPEGEAGGYHCMRFEGPYDKTAPDDGSFQLHMGRLVTDGGTTVTDCHFMVMLEDFHFNVAAGGTTHLTIRVDMNEWMDNPLFDFTAMAGGMPLDGPTMPNHAAQALMRDNGSDVFTLAEHHEH